MESRFVGSGVYDAAEVGHLLAVPVECVVRWSAPDRRGRPAIVAPSFGRAFSFADLVSLGVVSELWKRHVADTDMRQGVHFLTSRTRYEKPLAHRDIVDHLATSGTAWLADLDGGWYDIGKGGQGAFKEIVRLWLKRVSYDEGGLAQLWRPAPLVVLNPRVQAGKPCVEGTRVPTETIVAMLEADPPEVVAEDLDLTMQQVEAAAEFEAGLLTGRGIAA
jgi:uncharacterized protein (DUF433 family)